jgi:hypothetical protein
LVNEAVPVSVKVAWIDVLAPCATVDGVAVAEDEKVSEDVTVIVPAEVLECQVWLVALKTAT